MCEKGRNDHGHLLKEGWLPGLPVSGTELEPLAFSSRWVEA